MAEQKKVLISVPSALLEQLDGVAEKLGSSRNETVRHAIRDYVLRQQRLELNESLKSGYVAMAQINSEWAELCFDADCETLTGYEKKLAESEMIDKNNKL